MLNDLDRRLILALQEDGRVTDVELAARLGYHVSTNKKRVDQLEKKELVKVRALPNPFKLGYLAHALIAIKADTLSIDSICSSLGEFFHINLIVTTFGRYDILVIAYFPNWEDLLAMVSKVIPTVKGIRVIDTFMVKEIKKRHYSFTKQNVEPVKIDEIDQQLIERLTEDGRIKYRTLAQELGISLSTCSRRLSRLLAKEVIEIKGVAYMSKVEDVSNAFLFLQVRPEKLDEVCSILNGYDEIYLNMTLLNGYSLVTGFNTHNPEELFHLKNRIMSIDGVIDGEITVRAEVKKRYYGGFLK
jgi:DNA-binding Lrp family transcriptional regulator